VTLQIELNKLLILPGALDLVKRGFITRANKTNREFSQSMIRIDADGDNALLEMVFDPQTSGGLLISVPSQHAEALVNRINEQGGFHVARIVGSIRPRQEFALFLK
jgi:selenide,water dikinase